MKFAEKEDKKVVAMAKQEKPEVAQVHPFVTGLANAGAILGRDIGALALRCMNQARGEGFHDAVLYWPASRVPTVLKQQVPDEMLARLHGMMIVPDGTEVDGILFGDTVRAASRILTDGSRLVLFEKIDAA
jgi:hypothetical protein